MAQFDFVCHAVFYKKHIQIFSWHWVLLFRPLHLKSDDSGASSDSSDYSNKLSTLMSKTSAKLLRFQIEIWHSKLLHLNFQEIDTQKQANCQSKLRLYFSANGTLNRLTSRSKKPSLWLTFDATFATLW